MYVPSAEGLAEQARQAEQMRVRKWVVIALGVLLLLSITLPHLALRDEPAFGRSLLPTSFYFLHVQSPAFGSDVNGPMLAFGFNVAYLGLALHQFGALLGVATFWSLYPAEINRWIYRLLVVGGWMMLLSSPLVLGGAGLIATAGVPTEFGLAWACVLLSGLIIVIGARLGKARIDRTWYLTRPELM